MTEETSHRFHKGDRVRVVYAGAHDRARCVEGTVMGIDFFSGDPPYLRVRYDDGIAHDVREGAQPYFPQIEHVEASD